MAETLEEIAQGAIQDATVRTFDENRDLLERIPETAIRTAIATLPFAVFGGGMAIRQARVVTPEAPAATPAVEPTITPPEAVAKPPITSKPLAVPPFQTRLEAALKVAFEQPEKLGMPVAKPPAVKVAPKVTPLVERRIEIEQLL